MEITLTEFLKTGRASDAHAICLTMEFICKAKNVKLVQNYFDNEKNIGNYQATPRDKYFIIIATSLLKFRNVEYDPVLFAKIKKNCMKLLPQYQKYVLAISQTLCVLYNMDYTDSIEENFNAVICKNVKTEENFQVSQALQLINESACIANKIC